MTTLHGVAGDSRPARLRDAEILLAGDTGRVGRSLVGLIEKRRDALREESGIDLQVTGRVNRARVQWEGRGGEATDWKSIVRSPHLGRNDAERSGRCRIFVDCTGSEEVASTYGQFFEQGMGVVTPNKLAPSAAMPALRSLRESAARNRQPFLYETTVGAALPLLSTIADLRRSGDVLLQVSAVLSGTVSHILERLHDGRPFTASLREAYELGLTEPDPTIDLQARDVVRKLVIMLREAGIEIDCEDVAVEPLIDPSFRFDGDIEAFEADLAPLNGVWRRRVQDARAGGNRLALVASWREGKAAVAVGAVDEAHPVARVRAGENVVVIRTARYREVPLTIAGPGAGPEVTAAGVLSDVVRAARFS